MPNLSQRLRAPKFWYSALPLTAFALLAIVAAYIYVDPAPPAHIVIATGETRQGFESEYAADAKQYGEIIQDDHVRLETRATAGATENLKLLKDPNSGVDVGFVHDGLADPNDGKGGEDLVSLGSLYYEPFWVFYRGTAEISRLDELDHRRLAIGQAGSGTRALTLKLLATAGVRPDDTDLRALGWEDAAKGLETGQLDAAFFIATADDPIVIRLLKAPGIRLMTFDQAEAITRHLPYLHHLVLPEGAIDLERNLPTRDIHLVATTATLVAKDTLHPALVYLLLKAATQTHSAPGILEHKGEFPIDKDEGLPLSEEAERYYKTGTPFWQRHLPFWLATLVDRFIFLIVPLLVLLLPLLRLIPRAYQWRMRSKIFQRYGELKFLESNLDSGNEADHLRQLDEIEGRVNRMKLPLEYSEYLYSLRGHIEFVRGRLRLRE